MEKNTIGSRPLRRTHEGRLVAGVCSGAGRWLGVDPNFVRLGLAVFTLFGGAGIALYAIGWLLIPDEGAPKSIAEDLARKTGDSPAFQEAVQKAKDKVNGKKHTAA